MKIELKRISLNRQLSEETACFSADLWVEGRKIGTVANRGTGGCDEFHGDQDAYDRADAWCKANLPRWRLFEGEADHPTDLEMHCAGIVARHEGEQQMARKLKARLLVKLPDRGGLWEFKANGDTSSPQTHAAFLAKYPGAVILNALPKAEAYTLYSECSE